MTKPYTDSLKIVDDHTLDPLHRIPSEIRCAYFRGGGGSAAFSASFNTAAQCVQAQWPEYTQSDSAEYSGISTSQNIRYV